MSKYIESVHQEQEKILREIHRKISLPEFRSLPAEEQIDLLHKTDDILNRELVLMNDKRRLLNLISVLNKEESVESIVSEILNKWEVKT